MRSSRLRGKGRRLRLLSLVAITAVAAAFVITSASAVHDAGLFQLDRNATDSGAGDDWNTRPKPEGAAAVFTGILEDNATAEQFTGGGSKDNSPIEDWLWKEGEPLDKDNITNAYAAGYVSTVDTGDTDVGDFIVYFGLDRLANNGSAQVGFWFFRSAVGLSNTKSGGGFKFSGSHSVGDILVQSNFSQGGVISTVSVYKWVGSGGSHGPLHLLFEGADCVDSDPNTPGDQPLGGDDPACATANQETTDAPWSYAAKFPDPNNPTGFPQGSFFEGGINISRLVPDVGCLSTFMAETRSSTPFDARLFDFAFGDFNTCVATVATTSSPTGGNVVPGTSVTDTATVTGSSLAGGTTPTPQGTVDFFLCQPSEVTSAGCPTGGTKVGATKTLNASGVATSDATTNTTAIGKYCWRAVYNPATGSPYPTDDHTNATTECFTTVAQPTTTSTRQFVYPQDKAKIGATSGGNLAGNVTFKLYDSLSDCQANTDVKFTSPAIAVSGAAPQTATTNNTTYAITDGTTHYWKVTYVSTNASQLGSVSDCAESTAVTYAGNDATITVP